MGKVASAFVSLADTLVEDFDVVDLLYELVYTCVDVLDASAAGLLLASKNGQLHIVAASSEGARILELFQIQNQEGPCLDCFRSGSPVRSERLDGSEARWPSTPSPPPSRATCGRWRCRCGCGGRWSAR